MKKVLYASALALVLCATASARTQSNNIVPSGTDAAKPAASEDEKKPKGKESGKPASPPAQDKPKQQDTAAQPATATATPLASDSANAPTTDAPAKSVSTVPTAPPAKAAEPPLTNLYRVGVGDVLDIRLLNATTRESTLFTVMSGGLVEYPLAGEAIQAAGLTTDEIDQRLTAKVKLYEKPELVVSVREYASHSVIVSGLVDDPGTKVMRREAMPLYVLLAEARLKPEAGRATIMHADGQSVVVNLADQAETTALVLPGDVVTVTATPPAPRQFFYVGGQVVSPGQKDFHAGITLTQAVLASGGTTRFAGSKVKVSRQGADGRLVSTEFNLKQIEAGKIPDPLLQPGDRLEVGRGSW